MSVITVTEAKAHCRVTNSLEDSLFTIYVNAADDWIKNYLNQDLIPQEYAVKAAALLIVEDLYKNRGASIKDAERRNPAVCSLLYPYRTSMGF